MVDPSEERVGPAGPDRLAELIDAGEATAATERLAGLERAAADDRKNALQAIRSLADDRSTALPAIAPALEPFLTDEERSIRLTTAKTFVAMASADPDALVPSISPLAERLADEDEFYYVRARAAEALGYVARENPDAVASPEVLADLRIGLAFDEVEVREKLAKAIEHVALGDPGRLRHLVTDLAEHLDDENEHVRYHLCTTLAAVGTGYPERVAEVWPPVVDRLADETPFVRGRALETAGILALADAVTDPPIADIESALGADETFLAERASFALTALEGNDGDGDCRAAPGTIESIRATTDDAVAAMTEPDQDGECPNCGLAVPENGPPLCPRCGAPH